MKVIILIISASISMLIFDKINSKYDFFKDIRSKINDLNEKKEHKLRISSYVLILIIYGVMQNTKINIIVQGLIFGLLLSFRDICFKKDSNE
ncbi:hypothetical protein [Terrisporobacter sp.]|uniref:hypothetical protein n=1 Tax=Terrisporobacter sp. TaxID=1965305 RepID=UPI00263137D7|nr:hypothetical protein [Terrisporobacter sp.]